MGKRPSLWKVMREGELGSGGRVKKPHRFARYLGDWLDLDFMPELKVSGDARVPSLGMFLIDVILENVQSER